MRFIATMTGVFGLSTSDFLISGTLSVLMTGRGLLVPAVVLELLLGVVIGPQVLGLEVSDFIKKEPRQSGEIYIRMTNEKRSGVGEIAKMISDPDNAWTTTPQNAMRYVEFMHKVGTLKKLPADWRELFMPESHGLAGG